MNRDPGNRESHDWLPNITKRPALDRGSNARERHGPGMNCNMWVDLVAPGMKARVSCWRAMICYIHLSYGFGYYKVYIGNIWAL